MRSPKAGDGEAVHKAILDGYEDYIKWLCWPQTPPTIEEVEIECRKHQAEFILRDCIRYLIIEKESGRVVGRCAYPPVQVYWNIPQFGISYFISASFRKRGYASEAAYYLAHNAFDNMNAKKVEIYCDVKNEASNLVPQKLGFVEEYRTKGTWPSTDDSLAEICCYVAFNISDLTNPRS